jgi:hypothetical protein
MSDIKKDLKEVVEKHVIPEVEDYLDDLHKLLEKKEETSEDILIIKEMESFLVELHNILAVIEQDELSDDAYEIVYNKIMRSVEESNLEK